MYGHQHKATSISNNEENMTLPKQQSKMSVIDPKKMEICELLDKEF